MLDFTNGLSFPAEGENFLESMKGGIVKIAEIGLGAPSHLGEKSQFQVILDGVDGNAASPCQILNQVHSLLRLHSLSGELLSNQRVV